MEHNIDTCPIKKDFEKLEQERDELHATLQLSGVYGKSLLEENNCLKQKIKEIQAANEVITYSN